MRVRRGSALGRRKRHTPHPPSPAVQERGLFLEPPMDKFTPTSRSRVKRLPDRGRYDVETVYEIMDAAAYCHVGYVIDGKPYVTPTAHWRHGNRVFWHGSSASRMLEHQAEGHEVCLNVTHIDGFVLAR